MRVPFPLRHENNTRQVSVEGSVWRLCTNCFSCGSSSPPLRLPGNGTLTPINHRLLYHNILDVPIAPRRGWTTFVSSGVARFSHSRSCTPGARYLSFLQPPCSAPSSPPLTPRPCTPGPQRIWAPCSYHARPLNFLRSVCTAPPPPSLTPGCMLFERSPFLRWLTGWLRHLAIAPSFHLLPTKPLNSPKLLLLRCRR